MNGFCRRALAVLAVSVFIGAGWMQPAAADGYHYNNILIGDRAAGLGGAYTAVADDPSGLYYNPAGVVYATGSNVNGSMNALHRTLTRYKSVLGGRDWTRDSKSLTPNFVGFTQPFAGGTLGLSWAVTDSILEDQDQDFENLVVSGVGIDRYIINSNNQDTTYNAGPSFAYKLSDNLSVGATLYLFYRNREHVFNQQLYLDDGSVFWSNNYLEGTEIGIKPILGVMWSPFDTLSLGLSVRKTQLLYADFRRQTTESTYVADDPAPDPDPLLVIPEPEIATGDTKRDLPWQVNVGVAWFPSDRWLISGEIDYYSAVEDLRWITNFALGVEYYVSSKWALRTGVYSNLASTEELKAGEENQSEHVDMYGFSISLTHFTRNNAFTGGISTSKGSGEAQVLDSSTDIQDVEITTMTIYLSTTYTY
jgi:long-chain fatty acid transport protein